MDENTLNEKFLAMQGKSSEEDVSPGAVAVRPTFGQYSTWPAAILHK